jgi:putative transposase
MLQSYHQWSQQALGTKYSGELYEPSPRPYKCLSKIEYPFRDRTITVSQCARMCMDNRKINLSIVFAEQNVGVKQVADQVWLVSFMDYPCVQNRPLEFWRARQDSNPRPPGS